MMHLKRCKFVTSKPCVMCQEPHDPKYEALAPTELKTMLTTQQPGMDALLRDVGLHWSQPYTIASLRDDLEFYFKEFDNPTYKTYTKIVGRGCWASNLQYGHVADPVLKLSAKTELNLDTYRSIVMAYGGLPKDIQRRFSRNPSAPNFLWPVLKPYHTLAHVEDEKGEPVCIGRHREMRFGCFDPEVVGQVTPDSVDKHLDDVRDVTHIQAWLKAGNIRYSFRAKGIALSEEKKSPEFKHAEKLYVYNTFYQKVLGRLEELQKRLKDDAADKGRGLLSRYVATELLSELAAVTSELQLLLRHPGF